MRHWNERPCVRVLAFVLALLLALNTIPSGGLRTFAIDGGTESGSGDPVDPGTGGETETSAKIRLMAGETGEQAVVDGTYTFSKEGAENISGSFTGGVITVKNFEDGETYSLSVSLQYTYVYDGNRYLTAPDANQPVKLVDGDTSGTLKCGTVSAIQRSGYVKAEDILVPVSGATVTVSSDGIEPIVFSPTGVDGAYTVVLPAALINQEVSVNVQRNGYVTKTEKRIIPDNPVGEDPQLAIGEISLTPVTTTIAVDEGGYIYINENSGNQQAGIVPIQSPDAFTFTVVPYEYYQVDKVTMGSDTLSGTNGTYSITPGTEDATINVSFIKIDTTPPVIEWATTDPSTGEEKYYWYCDNTGTDGLKICGRGDASKAYFTVKDVAAQNEAASGIKKIYLYQGDLGTITVEDFVAHTDLTTIELGGVAEYTFNGLVEPGYYLVCLEDMNGKRSGIMKLKFEQDNTAPTINGIAISSEEDANSTVMDGIELTSEAYASANAMYLKIEVADSGTGFRHIALYKKAHGSQDEYTPTGNTYAVEDGNNGKVVIPIEATEYSTITDLAIKAVDKAGNETEIMELTGQNKLERTAVVVTSGEAVITATSEKTPVDSSDNPPVKIFGEDPEYTFTFTGAYGEQIENILIKVNGTDYHTDTEKRNSGYEYTLTNPTGAQSEPLLREGLNTIVVSCKSVLGTEDSDTFLFYLDLTKPTVTGIEIAGVTDTTVAKEGDTTYANGPVVITVTTEDGPTNQDPTTEEPGVISKRSSGVSKVIVYDNTSGQPVQIAEGTVDESGTAKITLPIDYTSGILYNYDITVSAVDAVGNACDAVAPPSLNPLEPGKICITDALPKVEFNMLEGVPFNNETWYKNTPQVGVNISPAQGMAIKAVSIKVNGQEVAPNPVNDGTTVVDNALLWEPFLATDILNGLSPDASGAYKIEVSVTDNFDKTTGAERTIYVDSTAPVITDVSITSANVHKLSHGNYANGPITVSVTAADSEGSGKTSVESITLVVNGVAVETQETTNGSYTFTVAADALNKSITAYATDIVGNNSNTADPVAVMFESTVPAVSAELIGNPAGRTVGSGTDARTWYSENVTWQIGLSDSDSGLASYTIKLNGTALSVDSKGDALPSVSGSKVTSQAVSISTAQATAKSDCSYTLEVVATDNAGNQSTVLTKTVYIDGTLPTVTAFEVTKANAADKLESYDFGTFGNGAVNVKVTVQDPASGTPASGIASVILYVNGEKYEETAVAAGQNTAVCTFTVPKEVTSSFAKGVKLSAQATDRSGNLGPVTELTTTNSNLKSGQILLENNQPKASIAVTVPGGNSVVRDGREWYSADTLWNISVNDADAGIAAVAVTVNGRAVTTDRNGANIADMFTGKEPVKEAVVSISSANYEASSDSSYTLSVTVTDLAGNVSETVTRQIFRDSQAPSVTGFRFFVDGEEKTKEATQNQNDYGFFFTKNVTVKISASEPLPGAGLKSITYYLEDAETGKTEERTVDVDASGEITITLNAPFKGKIYAKATDFVMNGSAYSMSTGLVIETGDAHNNAAHIAFEKAATDFRQVNGVELYNGNVELTLRVTDAVSGIRSIEWSIVAPYDQAKNQNGVLTVGADGSLSGDAGWVAETTDANLATELRKTIVVSHDSNDIVVRVKMTDRAGHQTERTITFGIDKVAPVIEYSFDDKTPDRDNPTIYNSSRTMTITVTERNFVPGEFAFNIHNAYGSVPTASQWTEERDVQDPNNSTYTATVTFTYDGSYTVGLAYADRAGNRAAIDAVPAFVIDQSKPLVLVTYDNKKPVQDIYFDNFRTATVTVTEKNFDVSRVTFTGNAPRTGSWTANGDEHTLIIYYDEDGDYSFGISVTDKAGNVSVPYDEENFIIDTTAPELDLSGLLAANRGEVAPVITYTDANYLPDGVSILLMRQSGEIISKPYTLEDIVEDGEVKGYRVVFKNFDPMKENDDIYTISISAVDHAGNRTKEIMRRFSVNRFGSTYIMDGAERMNRVNTNNPTDLSVLEINVDEINSADVEIFVIRNSSPKKLEQGVDYVMEEVKSEDADWKEYRYTIKNTAFMEDGEYTIRIISTDKAGNVNENDENGKNGTISFCVDRIAPNIVVVSPVDEESYKEDTHHAVIEVRDNYLLDDVKIYLNDQEISYARNNYQYSFDIPQSDTKQTIRIVATDAAGNVSEVYVKDFLVSTNMFVRFLNTPWAAVTFIVILLGVGAGAVLLLTKKRRRVS